MKFRFYVVNLDESTVYGTNDQEKIEEYLDQGEVDEEYVLVIDTSDDTVAQAPFEDDGEEIKELNLDEDGKDE
jgi:hypothetical protein